MTVHALPSTDAEHASDPLWTTICDEVLELIRAEPMVEYKQRSGQESSTHSEQARQDACDRAQKHNQKPVHRQVCDRQIDGQDIFHKERPSPAAPRFKVATSREPI